jgi:hypothetical protein
MAQAVSRRPPTAETRIRSQVSLCGICVGQNGTGTGSSPSTSVFPCQFHSTGAPLHGKMKKLIIFLFIFITGLHKKPQGCCASVVSTAGPFITKKSTKFSTIIQYEISWKSIPPFLVLLIHKDGRSRCNRNSIRLQIRLKSGANLQQLIKPLVGFFHEKRGQAMFIVCTYKWYLFGRQSWLQIINKLLHPLPAEQQFSHLPHSREFSGTA